MFVCPQFATKSQKVLEEIKERNLDNKLFLATATAWNYEKTRDAFLWFAQYIDVIMGYDMIEQIFIGAYTQNDDEIKKFALNLLHEADINITDYALEKIQVDLNSNIGIPEPVVKMIKEAGNDGKLENIKIKTGHNISTDGGRISKYDLEMTEESLGTRNIFFLAPALWETFKNGKVLCIDEIENHLHPQLVEYLVSLFNNPKINKTGAQIIFTTHDLMLMSTKFLRRDQIYFVDKNLKEAYTELFSLDEFSVRKNENVRKAYLLGRYGAVPFLGDGELLWQ